MDIYNTCGNLPLPRLLIIVREKWLYYVAHYHNANWQLDTLGARGQTGSQFLSSSRPLERGEERPWERGWPETSRGPLREKTEWRSRASHNRDVDVDGVRKPRKTNTALVFRITTGSPAPKTCFEICVM